MTAFTRSEILNEVARIFRSRLDVGRDGGTLNTNEEYDQLLEMTSTTFLLHNDAIFYLGKLVSNRLNALNQREIAILEDILVALDDLSQVGEPVRDTATLNNAYTALLALDAASSVQQRPETKRFSVLMDQFSEKLRKNVVSQLDTLVRPREEARNILSTNLGRLKDIHRRLLELISSLRDLMDNFVALDIPSKTSVTAMANIRTILKDLTVKVGESSDADNVAGSRTALLRTLTSKTAIELIAGFTDPRNLKYRGPTLPIPSYVKHTGRVTGEGEPATLESAPGSWLFPISEVLQLKVNAGSTQTVDFNTLVGMALNGSNHEPFKLDGAYASLMVLLDPLLREAVVTAGGNNYAQVPYQGLSFKHLGAPILFMDMDAVTNPSDINYRAVTELRLLQNFASMTYEGGGLLLLSTASLVDDPGPGGIREEHVGAYVRDTVSGERFEILDFVEAVSATSWRVRVSIVDPGTTPGSVPAELRGDVEVIGSSVVYFERPLIGTATGRCIVGPVVKHVYTGGLPAASVQDVIDATEAESGVDATYQKYGALRQHVMVRSVANDPTRLALAIRSRKDPFLQVVSTFIAPSFTSPPAAANFWEGAMNVRVGIPTATILAPFDTNDMLTAQEAADAVSGSIVGVVADVLETVVHESILSTVEGTKTVQDPTADFIAAGVESGDILELGDGLQAGVFRIETVSTSTLSVRKAEVFTASESGRSYKVKRQRLRIQTERKTRGSSLQAVSSPSELGLVTEVQYGSIPFFEAVDKRGNLLEWEGLVEGDILRIRGRGIEVPISRVDGTTIELSEGIDSNLESVGFEVQSVASKEFITMQEDLKTFTTNRNLLIKNNFDESVDAIDNALTTAVLPGRNFIANRNNARRIVAELLSLLTSSPKRSDEYDAVVPVSFLDLEAIIAEFDVSPVQALDSIINAMLDRKFDRAVDLLRTGKLREFFSTNDETGSYAGAMISASRTVVRDLPEETTIQHKLDRETGTASAELDDIDPDIDFSDTEDEYEIDD